MRTQRTIWIIWCLIWVLIWLGLGLHDALAWADCQNKAQTVTNLLGPGAGNALNCGSNDPGWGPVIEFALAVFSGLAILIPVGTAPGSFRAWLVRLNRYRPWGNRSGYHDQLWNPQDPERGHDEP